MLLLLLTLDKHKDGIWILKLVEELHHIDGVSVRIAAIDTFFHENVLFDDDAGSLLSGYRGVINRVSDAADAICVKKCLAVLNYARLLNIPIFNGPTAYSLCCNKWCHHVLFARAGLQSPSTAIIDVPSQKMSSERLVNTSLRLLPNESLPHLLKPNSGGFGEGITKIDDIDDDDPNLQITNDDTILLQKYVSPAKDTIYRVWFLLGKVQCAVRRIISSELDEFTSGCVAGGGNVCPASAPFAINEAWLVPEDVRAEIEQNLLVEFYDLDAHAGSVEFLIDDATGQRLYFDLNLLSTLPVDVSKGKELWGEKYNPWAELAESVLVVLSTPDDDFSTKQTK
jgi:hypothetical protein